MDYKEIINSLSPEQMEIAQMEAETQMFVTAGPGTGKTHTMIQRLVHLISTEGLLPHQDILVLSFSRAAVNEIRMRLHDLTKRGAPDNLRFLNVRTFDSFATRLLAADEGNTELFNLGFDERIALAVKQLSNRESPIAEILRHCRHVVVDEVQDLVGLRAQLVQKVLGLTGGSFSLFGDPAQGIYDYLAKPPNRGPTSSEFLAWLVGNHPKLIVRDLNHNYRIRTSAADIAGKARDLVLDERTNVSQAYKTLTHVIKGMDDVGNLVRIKDVNRFHKKRVALLCRTNAEALFAARRLIQQDIEAIVPPSVEERGSPPWIARMFSTWPYRTIDQSVFFEQWQARIGTQYLPKPAQAWNFLKIIEGRDRQDLDLEILKAHVRKGFDWTFESEAQNADGVVLTTTIHQSKGREYDTVLILPPEQRRERDADTLLDEARVLYVAATRARDEVLRIGRRGLPIMYPYIGPSKRERMIGQEGEDHHLLFESGLPGDIDDSSFTSIHLFPKIELVHAVQGLIWNKVNPGTKAVLIPETYNGQVRLVIALWIQGHRKHIPVGLMSETFQSDLEMFLRSKAPDRRRRFPPIMPGLIVYERRTLILPPYPEGVHEPFASSGFCLGIALKGALSVN